MSDNAPTLDQWRRLYQAMARLKDMAPWGWMTETDLFGVQDPEADALGFVSVMGMAGEHMAVSVYLGAQGLHGFLGLQTAGPNIGPEAFFAVPQLQASFEDRDMLDRKDRRVIKKLDLTFRGRRAWPLFRSYRPGCFPWFLEAAEARFLTHALEQTCEVTPRFKDDPALLETSDGESYLVRAPGQKGESLTWEERTVRVPPPVASPIPVAMDDNCTSSEEIGQLGRFSKRYSPTPL